MNNYFLLGFLIGSLFILIFAAIYIFWLRKTHKEEVDLITTKYNREKADNQLFMNKILLLKSEKYVLKAKANLWEECVNKLVKGELSKMPLNETLKTYIEYLRNNN